jgi:mannose-1-phosphate guanylyltransferase/mannose-6-phosphate isomerase
MEYTRLVPIILSGGTGSRLWPLSRESHPKPFLTLPDGQSLLQKTFLRACSFSHVEEIITITNKEYYLKSKAEYEKTLPDITIPPSCFLLEPYGRNTAPAIALAALKAAETFGPDVLLLVLPADHLVENIALFVQDVEQAYRLANNNQLVTFGIKPTAPETGFGYIEYCPDNHKVERFIEKPNAESANEYVTSGRFLWNSGIFCFKASVILEKFALHAPDLLEAAKICWEETKKNNSNPSVLKFEMESFSKLPDISIDYVIMEKSQDLAVIPCHFTWQDIGSWEAYKTLFQSDSEGNTVIGEAVLIDSQNNFIHSEGRMVASIGIHNLAIIDTPDAMLIMPRNRTQDVKQIVQKLKHKAHESYLNHRTVIRPWGSYTVLEEGLAFKIKRIVVKPFASLSLQQHQHRSEHWVIVEGCAKVVNGEKEYLLQTNESTFIPMCTPHRLANPNESNLVIIEVQTGHYLGEDDILRFEDIYGRVT